MVKKLFRQEMLYYVRSLLPVYIILLGVALMGRIIQIFETDSWIYMTVSTSASIAYAIAVAATAGLTVMFCIVRYYKNMFSGEGYLTLTLPVTYGQHLRVKLGAALVTTLATVVAVLLSLLVFLTTDWVVELWKAGVFLLREFLHATKSHGGFYIAEFILLILAALAQQILFYYMCISLGQTFRKNRILAAIGIYYGIYLLTQVLATILIIILSLEILPLEAMFRWIELHQFAAVHVLLLGGTVIVSLISLGLYYVSRWVLHKRLNLE